MKKWLTHHYYKLPVIRHLNEIIWANVYSDSIRGYSFLNDLSLNIGRFACNYTLLYLTHRIVNSVKPKRVLEIGLGESTKFLSTFINHTIDDCKHFVVEHNKEWISFFPSSNLYDCTEIKYFEVEKSTYNGNYKSLNYVGFETLGCFGTYEVIIIDGPHGTKNFSRNDVLQNLEHLIDFNNFTIVFDDTNRSGELQTYKAMLKKLKTLGVKFGTTRYYGSKIVSIIYSDNYKYFESL
ncbi:hypothetical protein [Nonlabens ulvanivorans]|uniref:Class I SAM-dependent methyltransferase n=1 Tax=Nonlabens ulvanivorans TaxID=906888 RepID=A0A084JTY8_NONUL|nr:hypothetical protein [Nonlabens ulvanivorans]KEZ92422.1 hypothetical protein IL45_09730 [Nonlabens ulvanivorans]PRX15258.1 hypothetical protein LY02_00473 [Nonlabens ulvanivorans]